MPNEVAAPAEEPRKPSETAPIKAIQLPDADLKTEDFYRQRWRIPAPAGTTKDDARSPAFWGKIAHRLRRDDIVFLFADDGSWELECWVEHVQQKAVVVSIAKNYSRTPLQDTGTRLDDNYYTERRGIDAWCVVRAVDGIVMTRGHALEAIAMNQFYASQPRAA
jgi:hypothetical protein